MPKPTVGKITQLISTKPDFYGKGLPEIINGIPDYKLGIAIKQKIHFLSLKASSTDGYEQSLQALTGRIVTLTTTPQHLIVVTE